MSDKDEEKGTGYKVTDKRRFAIDEEGHVIASDAEPQGAATPDPAASAPAPEPEPAPRAESAPRKKSLRERILDKLSSKDHDQEPLPGGDEGPLPEIDFSAFVFSLSTSALIHFGEVEDPMTREKRANLPAAKQTIDLLGMLAEKTKGNLTPEEDRFLQAILYDLRVRFVALSKKSAS